MALVRDPDAAARYAADPAGALAAAGLAGVTFADVNNLIPVVTDSLAAANPGFGRSADRDLGAHWDLGAGDGDLGPANVWLSSAAAAAFDAFDLPLPADTPAAEQATSPAVIIAGDPLPDESVRATSAAALDDAPIPAQPVQSVTTDWADEIGWPHHNHADASHADELLGDAPATGEPSGF